MSWTPELQPFGANHAPLLTGWASDGSGAIPVAVDPATGSLIAIVSSSNPTTVKYGQATISVTSTAVQLSNQAVAGVVVQALAGNAGNVVIGDASVTTANGFQLQPGQSTGIAISNVNKLYVNGTSGDGVCWIGS